MTFQISIFSFCQGSDFRQREGLPPDPEAQKNGRQKSTGLSDSFVFYFYFFVIFVRFIDFIWFYMILLSNKKLRTKNSLRNFEETILLMRLCVFWLSFVWVGWNLDGRPSRWKLGNPTKMIRIICHLIIIYLIWRLNSWTTVRTG